MNTCLEHWLFTKELKQTADLQYDAYISRPEIVDSFPIVSEPHCMFSSLFAPFFTTQRSLSQFGSVLVSSVPDLTWLCQRSAPSFCLYPTFFKICTVSA